MTVINPCFPAQVLTSFRKQAVSSQSAELEALEVRLRETEERLKERQSRTSSPAGRAAGGINSPHRRQPLGNTFDGQENDRLQSSSTTSPLATQAQSPQSVSSSTMSHWRPRPAAQDAALGGGGDTRDVSADQLSGQQGSRYS